MTKIPKAGNSAAFGIFHAIKKILMKHEDRNAPSGTRTQDPLIKSQLLYQLS